MITIITVCYNSEQTIRKTIESVLNQTYKDYEYLIIDGKSTDKTLEIVKEYENAFEGKLKIVSEKDNGIYDAMNKGINLAQGELIGMINSDDWYESTALETMVNAYDGSRYAILYGMQREYMNGKEKMCWIKNHEFLNVQMINHPTCFITKELYHDLGNYDVQYKSSADYDFMLKMFRNEEVIFQPVYSIISNFALGGMSGTNIGRIETAKIKYKYGIISKSQMYRIVAENRIKIIIKKILRKKTWKKEVS